MKDISVIIPVYNAAKFLPRCLDSVINQTFKNIEIICINDGSTDASLVILKSYQDKRIKIIDKKNGGVSAARNDGIVAARGKYIHFFDADDWIDLDYYEKMIGAGDTDIIASGFVSNSKYTRGIKYTKNKIAKTMFGKLWRTNAIVDSYVWRYLFRRDFIIKNKLKFRTDLISQEDAVFVLDAIAAANAVAICAGPCYHYVENSDSALNSRNAAHRKKIKEQYKIGKKYRRDFARRHNVMLLWYLRKFS